MLSDQPTFTNSRNNWAHAAGLPDWSRCKLRQNLEHQLPVYEGANQTKKSNAVVMCFTDDETDRTEKIMKELGLADSKTVVLIDASRTNKPSGSVARG